MSTIISEDCSILVFWVFQNHKDVMVVVDPDDYSQVLAKLQNSDDSDNSFRRRLAWKAFQHTSSYDSAVAEWLWKHQRDDGMLVLYSFFMT